jgi:N-acetylneuraminic acid mutarotase
MLKALNFFVRKARRNTWQIFFLTLPLAAMLHSACAKDFVDKKATDFYAGEDTNLSILHNVNGQLELAPYSIIGQWSTTNSPSNTSVYLASTAKYNGKIYLTGGFGSSDSGSINGPEVDIAQSNIWYGSVLPDGSIDEWKEVEDTSKLPQPTYGHASVVVNGRLYILGGRSTANTNLSAVYWAKIIGHDGSIKAYFQGNTWTAVAPLPQALFRPGAVFYEGRIYVLGGYDNTDTPTDVVYMGEVQPDGNILSWQALTNMPKALAGHCVLQASNKIYVLGGIENASPDQVVKTAYMATIAANYHISGWTPLTDLPKPVAGAAAVIAGGKIWFSGGISDISGAASAEVYAAKIIRGTDVLELSTDKNSWSRSLDLPEPIFNHCMVTFNNHVFTVGGLNSSGPRKKVYNTTLQRNKLNANPWRATTPMFQSIYGGNVFQEWTGHTAILRPPKIDDSFGSSSNKPNLFVIGGGENNFYCYPGGTGWNALGSANFHDQPGAYSTIYNSQIDSSGNMQKWEAPESAGTIPLPSILHHSTLSEGKIYIIGGANSLNALIWYLDAYSVSLCAQGNSAIAVQKYPSPTPTPTGTPYIVPVVAEARIQNQLMQLGQTHVWYENVGLGSSSGGAGSFEVTQPVPIVDDLWAYRYYQKTTYDYNGYNYKGGQAAPSGAVSDFGVKNQLGNPLTSTEIEILKANPIYQPLIRAGCVSYNNFIYIMGGISRQNVWPPAPAQEPSDSEPQFENRVWFCRPNPDGSINATPNVGGWQLTSPLPKKLYDFAAVVAYSRIYIFGGRDETGVINQLVYYSEIQPNGQLAAWTPVPGADLGADAAAEWKAVFVNGFIYLVGGTLKGDNPADPLEELKTETAYLGKMTASVICLKINPSDGSFYDIGGANPQFIITNGLSYPISGHQALTYNGVFYNLGGSFRYSDPAHSNAYLARLVDLNTYVDYNLANTGAFERYLDLEKDQLVENVSFALNPKNGSATVRVRWASEHGVWSAWGNAITSSASQTVNSIVRYINYKLNLTAGATNNTGQPEQSQSPQLNEVRVEYPASKRIYLDSFQINHNRFDPQEEGLVISYYTRDHSVADVTFRIYNLEGELIRKNVIAIPPGTPLPASGSWTWDGTNKNVELVANGVYIIQYNSGDTHKIRKVVVYKR